MFAMHRYKKTCDKAGGIIPPFVVLDFATKLQIIFEFTKFILNAV